MITISAFADEIAPELTTQMDVCAASGVHCIDVRGIDGVNVSKMPLEKVREYKSQMDGRGFSVPCIGSPIGKIRMDEDFPVHLELLKRTIEVARAFGADRIRVFSFYPSVGRRIVDERGAALDRLAAMVKVAESAGVTLYHENEHKIYGATPDGVKDIFATIRSQALKGIFDPANFVNDGFQPFDQCWKAGLDVLTESFHIKDMVPGSRACVPAGEGRGQIPEILADLAAKSGGNWTGYMTLEPHLAAAGQFSGHTGPQLFSKAAVALQGLLRKAGLPYR